MQFASVWSALSTSMNLACTVGPMLFAATLAILRWHAFFVLLGMYTTGHFVTDLDMYPLCSLLTHASAFSALT